MSLHSFATLGHVPDSLDMMLKRVAEIPYGKLFRTWILMHLLWTYVQFSRRPPPSVLAALQEYVAAAMQNRWEGRRRTDDQPVRCRITSASPTIAAL